MSFSFISCASHSTTLHSTALTCVLILSRFVVIPNASQHAPHILRNAGHSKHEYGKLCNETRSTFDCTKISWSTATGHLATTFWHFGRCSKYAAYDIAGNGVWNFHFHVSSAHAIHTALYNSWTKLYWFDIWTVKFSKPSISESALVENRVSRE